MRRWGMVRALSWAVTARNKRRITANLTTPEEQQLARDLIDVADVVVESFRPGTLELLTLGYDEASRLNSGVIYVRLSGYGQDGPYSSRTGYGSIGEPMGGMRYLTGEADRAPNRIGVSIGDDLAGLLGAIGALMALRAHSDTDRGQIVDVSIYESVLAVSEAFISE